MGRTLEEMNVAGEREELCQSFIRALPADQLFIMAVLPRGRYIPHGIACE